MSDAGVGTSVTVTVKRAWEISIDNFFNNQNVIIKPIDDLIGRPLTQFEFYFMIFFIICVIVGGFVFLRHRAKKNAPVPSKSDEMVENPDI